MFQRGFKSSLSIFKLDKELEALTSNVYSPAKIEFSSKWINSNLGCNWLLNLIPKVFLMY